MANLAERAARLNRTAPRRARSRACFALLTDEARAPDPLPLAARLPRGSLVVLRHYGAAPDRRAELGRALAALCRRRRLILMVAGDLDLAIALGAGLHLPEWRARQRSARIRLWRRAARRPLSVAAHGRAGLVRAAGMRADLTFLGPVFATASHPGAPGLGAMAFRTLARSSRVPVFALGGMTENSARRLAGSGAAGIGTVGGWPPR